MAPGASEKYIDSQTVLERPAAEGNSPVGDIDVPCHAGSRVRRDTRNPVGSWEDHLPRLNTCKRPIVHQYREGKVKRTLNKGVK